MSDTVYFIGSQQLGGGHLGAPEYFTDFAEAEMYVKDYHARGMTYMKVFEARPVRAVRVKLSTSDNYFKSDSLVLTIPSWFLKQYSQEEILPYLKRDRRADIVSWEWLKKE